MKDKTNTMRQGFRRFVQSHNLVRNDDHVLLAVSGGIDSMVMMDLFSHVRPSWNLTLTVVHVNHQLRGSESAQDEEFVRKAASSYKIPFYGRCVDVQAFQAEHKMSRQEAAREVRYRAFEEVRTMTGAQRVATAHQADDNAETVLMNALRGAGIRGLSGIPLHRESGSIIRPLLFATREEIEQYAHDAGIMFRTDSSNRSLHYTRNLVRHTVIPALRQEAGEDVAASLNRVSEIMRSLGARIEKELSERSGHIVSNVDANMRIFIPALNVEPLYFREELMLSLFRQQGIEPSVKKVQACLALAEQPTGRSLRLSRDRSLYRDRDHLVFGPPIEIADLETRVKINEQYSTSDFRFAATQVERIPERFEHNSSIEYVDAEKLGSDLLLRSWRDGDWFVPFGMDAKKKLSDFFTNKKIPLYRKRKTPILEAGGKIVWVCGLRLDNRFRITQQTRNVAKLEYIPFSGGNQ